MRPATVLTVAGICAAVVRSGQPALAGSVTRQEPQQHSVAKGCLKKGETQFKSGMHLFDTDIAWKGVPSLPFPNVGLFPSAGVAGLKTISDAIRQHVESGPTTQSGSR
ncbi:hypothetical protein [Alloactinosynnema sp. L-07]|uniref:hypothetical protein n=1 Tax=Alloactinosynnema sp. L-07 TaxID=1653480 RepID=UPI00065EFE35|nr:hypothetical protein [Alloactinosynnema sp. L-07]CRK61983.1 hypothetical protein [Alloactinosynnema sp. L-07]